MNWAIAACRNRKVATLNEEIQPTFQTTYKTLRNETMVTRKENNAGKEASIQLEQEV